MHLKGKASDLVLHFHKIGGITGDTQTNQQTTIIKKKRMVKTEAVEIETS